MNFHRLLQQREALLRTTRLANLAFAYARLGEFAARIERARLGGLVTVHPVDPAADRYCPVLVAHAGSQAVLDEHFLDEEVQDWADILEFLSQENEAVEFTFALEDMPGALLPWLRNELERGGVNPGGLVSTDDGAASKRGDA